MNDFWLCFVPLFVAVDAIGVLPMFLALTTGLERARLRQLIVQSVVTAGSVAVLFIAFGPLLLDFLGITVSDFMIAGGILLLVISLSDLLTGEKRQRQTDLQSLGAVPIGVPLITGPAVLTTCILQANTHGKLLTILAVLSNIALAGVVFWFSEAIARVMGRAGAKAVSKVASLLLAAIAVMLIRKGITSVIQ
ncbi:MAG: MarC family protein [Lentisphaeria bacterium]|jgi:multiple antibiotic resistance protein|nr:MarC family protein [Lentisphaeria bacterium]